MRLSETGAIRIHRFALDRARGRSLEGAFLSSRWCGTTQVFFSALRE